MAPKRAKQYNRIHIDEARACFIRCTLNGMAIVLCAKNNAQYARIVSPWQRFHFVRPNTDIYIPIHSYSEYSIWIDAIFSCCVFALFFIRIYVRRSMFNGVSGVTNAIYKYIFYVPCDNNDFASNHIFHMFREFVAVWPSVHYNFSGGPKRCFMGGHMVVSNQIMRCLNHIDKYNWL